MGPSVVTATVCGATFFGPSAGTSGVGLVSEGLLFDEELLNIFGTGIGFGEKRGVGCQDQEAQRYLR